MTHPDPFQTQTQLRERLTSIGRSPDKQFGQHFLIDRNLMMKLIDAAELGSRDTVLEVGAGTASLTGLLAQRAGAVVAVEIDEHLAPLALESTSTYKNVTLLLTDALAKKSVVAPEVMNALSDAALRLNGPLKLVANLPYDIATPLVVNLLIGQPRFERFCFTVQTEVAERFLAKPDSADYGLVSILSEVLTIGRRICKAPPEAFWPRPKVHSSMVSLIAKPSDQIPLENLADFAAFVRGFFQHRRQTISHIAKTLPNPVRVNEAIVQLPLEPRLRPENVTPAQWVALYQHAR